MKVDLYYQQHRDSPGSVDRRYQRYTDRV